MFLRKPCIPSSKRTFLGHTGADAIYILGSPWDALGMIAALEQDLGVPVVEPVVARIWEIQRRGTRGKANFGNPHSKPPRRLLTKPAAACPRRGEDRQGPLLLDNSGQ
jgi:hypothetical protein